MCRANSAGMCLNCQYNRTHDVSCAGCSIDPAPLSHLYTKWQILIDIYYAANLEVVYRYRDLK